MCACFEHKEPLRLSGTSGAARSLGRPDPAFPPGDGADRAQDEALSLVLHISSALPHSSSRGVRGWWCGLWVLIFHGDRAAVFAWGRRRCFRPPPQSCRRCSQELRGVRVNTNSRQSNREYFFVLASEATPSTTSSFISFAFARRWSLCRQPRCGTESTGYDSCCI